jgi:hypothetical protein
MAKLIQRHIIQHPSRKIIAWIKIIIVFILFAGLAGCTMIKMGSLFLAGRLDKTGFYAETNFLFRRGLILVPVQINDTPETYHFIYDTGAAFNVVSSALAGRFAMGPKTSDSWVDAGRKKEKTAFATIKRLTLGGVPFEGTGAAIFDLDRTPALRCYEADGAIGMNLIRLAPYWHIDYARQKIILTDQENRLPRLSPVLILPFKQNIQRIPEITLEWKDLRLPFEVDLGAAGGFSAPLEYWEKIQLREEAVPCVVGYGQVMGGALGMKTSRSRTSIIRNVQCGEYRSPSLLLSFYPEAFARVGNSFFSGKAVTFDWRKKEIRLTPLVPEAVPVLDTFGFGFSFNEKERALYVSTLYEKSPAEAAGIKIGDRILRINDAELDSITIDDYCHFFLEPDLLFGQGKTLSLQVESGGEQKTYTLNKTIILQ